LYGTEDGTVICICRDITQRKQAELALQQLNEELEQRVEERTRELQATEARLQRLAANLPGSIFQFRRETDGTPSFPYVSEGSRDIYELEPDCFLQAFDLIHPRDRESFDKAMQESARTLDSFQSEHRIITPSGVLKWVQVISKPERQEDGATVWDGLVIEISDRKQAEEELLLFKRAVESSSDAIALADSTGNLIYQNPAHVQLYACETLDRYQETGGIAACYPDVNVYQEMTQTILNGDSWMGEAEQRSRNGRHFPTIIRANGIRGESGELLGLLGTITDMSDRKAAEERLRQQETQYRQIFETVTDGLGIIDLETGELVEINRAYHQMHGYSYEEFMAMPITNYVHPDSLSALARFVEEIQADRTFFCQAQNIHRNGTALDIDVKGIPYPYNGKTHALAIVRDISEKVQLERDRDRREQALREKETLLQTTLEAGKMGCWCWHRSTDEMIWSDGVEKILGLPSTALGDTFEDYFTLIHPADREAVLQAIAHTLATEEEYKTEHRIVLPQGQIQWMRGTGELWRDDKGEAIGLLGSLLNDTDRKAAEIALVESAEQIHQQAQQEQLLNQIANEIRTSLDLDRILQTTVREIQRFLEVDRCHFAWYVREANEAHWDVIAEVQNPDLPSFVGHHHAANFGALSELLLRQQILRLDDIATVQDSAVQEALTILGNKSMLVLPVRSESGNFGIIACMQHQRARPWQDDEVEFLEAVIAQVAIALNQADLLAQSQTRAKELENLLTQLQRTQTQLIQSEKMSSLGQMVAGVAHEINNPVSFIHGNLVHADEYMGDLLGLLDLYQDIYPQPHPDICAEIEAIDLDFLKTDLQKLFQSMRVGTDRIGEIVKSLRTFSRLDEAEVKDVDLHDGIDSTLMILKTRLRAQNWRPEIQIVKAYGELPRVQCYAGQLNQVFMNILGNAIDALEERDRDRTPEHIRENPSQIRIQTQRKRENILIRISDNGPGMSETTRAKLFDPFFTTKGVGKGTGLGLSISYQIVTEKHHGKLSCTSQPGETAFSIEIPICSEFKE
ncbi:MAG: PAS domain S-box protein, partial [Spirulina sp.]